VQWHKLKLKANLKEVNHVSVFSLKR